MPIKLSRNQQRKSVQLLAGICCKHIPHRLRKSKANNNENMWRGGLSQLCNYKNPWEHSHTFLRLLMEYCPPSFLIYWKCLEITTADRKMSNSKSLPGSCPLLILTSFSILVVCSPMILQPREVVVTIEAKHTDGFRWVLMHSKGLRWKQMESRSQD
jgi:hypothetical protein